MKKILILTAALALTTVSGCDLLLPKSATFDSKDLVNGIFHSTMQVNSQVHASVREAVNTKLSKSSGQAGSILINQQINQYEYSSGGGWRQDVGGITGSYNYDSHGNFISAYLSLQFHFIDHDFVLNSNGENFTLNGAQSIAMVGTFTFTSPTTFGTASDIVISGGEHVSGPDINKDVMLNVTINLDSDGRGGSISGTVGDQTLNYRYHD